MALFTGVQHVCTINIVAPYLSPFAKSLEGIITVSASISVDVPYWPPYSTEKFISCVVPGPLQWFIHFGEQIVIAWTHTRWVRWMFQKLPLPAAKEVRDSSSGVTPCIVMKNVVILHHQVLSFSPESMRLRSLRHSEKSLRVICYNTRDKLISAMSSQYGTSTNMDALMVYDVFQTFGKRW